MKRRITKRRAARPAPREDDDITSQSSAEERGPAGGEQRFADAESLEERRLRLTRELFAESRQALPDDPFFLEEAEPSRRAEQPAPAALLAEAAQATFEARGEGFAAERLRGHRKPITAVAFGAAGELFTAGKDCALLVFRAGERRREVFSAGFPRDAHGHRDEVYCLEAWPEAGLLASAGKDQSVRLWRTEGECAGFLAELRGHQGPVHALCFRAETRELLSLSADRTLKVWALDQHALVQTLYGHKADPQAMAMLGGHSAVSVGYDRLPIVWRLDRDAQALLAPQPASLDCVVALDAQHFATGSESGELCLWSAAKRRPVFRLPRAHSGGWISALAAHAGLLASGGRDEVVNVYRVHLPAGKNPHLTRIARVQAPGVVTALRLSPTGTLLAAALAPEDRLGRWNAHKGAAPAVLLISLVERPPNSL